MSTRVCDDPELSERIMASRLAKAGLKGAYAEADSLEGQAAFRRFEQGRGTYFFGRCGRGKTYAAACCVRLALSCGYRARLVTAKRLLDQVKEGFDGGDPDALARAMGYGLLALDDMGAEKPTEWAVETLTELIDARAMAGRPTVITSNYSLGELSKRYGGVAGERIASRIGGACERVEMTGEDRRLHG